MPKLGDFHLVCCPQVGNKPYLQIIAQGIIVYSDEHQGGINIGNLREYTRRINKLASVGESSYSDDDVGTETDGESSYSNEDVETETVRVEEEEERVAEQGEEGGVVQ